MAEKEGMNRGVKQPGQARQRKERAEADKSKGAKIS